MKLQLVRRRAAEAETDAERAEAPVGVLDIGSNSVRLVIYERLSRAPSPVYNEKASCALGRGLAESGSISEKSIERALTAMRRFSLVARLSGVGQLYVLATAAVREASNGAAFIAEVEDILQTKVRILSGAEEAHFAAMGVISGMPGQAGLVGDLGGGSLELAEVGDEHQISGETLALGAIRLQDDSGNDPKKAVQIARERLAASDVLGANGQKVFTAIGGTWRSIAKLHQIVSGYPLHLIQHYEVPAGDLAELCEKIVASASGGKAIDGMERISSTRAELLPYGAAVLGEILGKGTFERAQFSALGVREGFLYDALNPEERDKDALLEACRALSALRARSPEHADELIGFTEKLVKALGEEETASERRLREAGCYLSDLNWRGHPDYRGEQAVDATAFGSFVAIDHPGRAFLAAAIAVRYMGLNVQSLSAKVLELAGKEGTAAARRLGAAFRVAYLLSAGRAGVLPRFTWAADKDRLMLVMPDNLAFLVSEKVAKRLDQLGSEYGRSAEIIKTPG